MAAKATAASESAVQNSFQRTSTGRFDELHPSSSSPILPLEALHDRLSLVVKLGEKRLLGDTKLLKLRLNSVLIWATIDLANQTVIHS